MRKPIKGASKEAENVVYPDTPHGFNGDYRPSYRKDKAEETRRKMLEWFEKHGVV